MVFWRRRILKNCLEKIDRVEVGRRPWTWERGWPLFFEVNKYYYKALNFVFILALPMSIGCILVSNTFVPVFLEKAINR